MKKDRKVKPRAREIQSAQIDVGGASQRHAYNKAARMTNNATPQSSNKSAPKIKGGATQRLYKTASRDASSVQTLFGSLVEALSFEEEPVRHSGRCTPNSVYGTSCHSGEGDYEDEERQEEDDDEDEYDDSSDDEYEEESHYTLESSSTGNKTNYANDTNRTSPVNDANQTSPLTGALYFLGLASERKETPPPKKEPSHERPESPTFQHIMDVLGFGEKHGARNNDSTSRQPRIDCAPKNQLPRPQQKEESSAEQIERTASYIEKLMQKGTNEEQATKNESNSEQLMPEETDAFHSFMDFVAFPEKILSGARCVPNEEQASKSRKSYTSRKNSAAYDQAPKKSVAFGPTPKKRENVAHGQQRKKNKTVFDKFMGTLAFPVEIQPRLRKNVVQVQSKEAGTLEKLVDDVTSPEKQCPGTTYESPKLLPAQKKEASTLDRLMDAVAFPEKQCPGTTYESFQEISAQKKEASTFEKFTDVVAFPEKHWSGTKYESPQVHRIEQEALKKEASTFDKVMDAVAFPEKQCGYGSPQVEPRQLEGQYLHHVEPEEGDLLDKTFDNVEGVFCRDDCNTPNPPSNRSSEYGRRTDQGKVSNDGRRSNGDYDQYNDQDDIREHTKARRPRVRQAQRDLLDHVCTGFEKYTCGAPGGAIFENDLLELRRIGSSGSDASSVSSMNSRRSQRGRWRSGTPQQSTKKPNLISRFLSSGR